VKIAKRMLDVFAATIALMCVSPLLVAIAIVVKLTSRGPIFYARERMGLGGRPFRLLKFRSMRVDAEADLRAIGFDTRRTSVGTFLRRTSLDELPQLFSVLTGDMSLVGPRPERPAFAEMTGPLKRKPGIAGWARAPKIHRIPGGVAEFVVRWLPVSKRAKEEIFRQVIADMRAEYLEEFVHERFFTARLVVARGYMAFVFTLIAFIGSATVKRVFEIWKLL